MAEKRDSDAVNDFLGSAHIFAYAISHVVEEKLWREAAGNQVTVSQLKLLKLVSLPGSHTISDVAAFLGISSAAASKAADKLVRRMLLRRSEGEADRRAIHLSLTGPGRRLLDSYDASARQRLMQIFNDVPVQDLDRVTELLDRLSARIVNETSKPEEICVQCGIYSRQDCLLNRHLSRKCQYTRQRERGQSQE
jgi:DNA-binding MarR family transcriptional regulator